jgi:NadR type nicotinamide-nucleotide adenylyltransferase
VKPEIIRIALIGPESSGKTTLCNELAEYFHTCQVPEFARDYISNLNRSYTKEDIIYCAEKQLESEDKLIKNANKILFSDTELIICKVWLMDVFGECPEWIEQKINENKYDLYLLTSPDLPFISDAVRENPLRRQYFFEWYKAELEKRTFPYKIIDGQNKERFNEAIESILPLIDKF